MAWGTITAADVEAHLGAGELDQYRQHAAQIEDPLPTLIADVISHVRGYLSARYVLTETGIPQELRGAAIDLVIHRLAKRCFKGSEDDADRKSGAEAAEALLKSAGNGEFGDFGTVRNTGNWGSATRFTT